MNDFLTGMIITFEKGGGTRQLHATLPYHTLPNGTQQLVEKTTKLCYYYGEHLHRRPHIHYGIRLSYFFVVPTQTRSILTLTGKEKGGKHKHTSALGCHHESHVTTF